MAFDLKAIMSRAWQLYRCSTPSGQPMNRAHFAKCLKAGWDLVKRPGSGGLFETYAVVLRNQAAAKSEAPIARININAIGSRAPKAKAPIFLTKRGTSHANFWGFGW